MEGIEKMGHGDRFLVEVMHESCKLVTTTQAQRKPSHSFVGGTRRWVSTHAQARHHLLQYSSSFPLLPLAVV